jgi:site-specific recombinase XerD
LSFGPGYEMLGPQTERRRQQFLMTNTLTNHPPLLDEGLDAFLRSLDGKNRSPATLRAYTTDLRQFIEWIKANNVVAQNVDQVERADVTEYVASLAQRGLTGVSRARKMAAIREYFRFLEGNDSIDKSPAASIDTPKKEKGTRTALRTDEYTRMLSEAGGNPRDYAILQVFLQTGIRISELCDLRLDDIDLRGHMLRVRVGKGMAARDIELERKGVQAIKTWLNVRPDTADDHLFLNRYAEPLGERSVRKLVTRYRIAAKITKRATPHSLRHTFATYKAEQGVSPFQLKEWLGHANLNTTQIYVHMSRQNAKKVMEATSL